MRAEVYFPPSIAAVWRNPRPRHLGEESPVKLGIVSDLHCNAAGLQYSLGLMGEIDELICLGDSIYEYRFSNEVVRLLKDREAQVILGNHEECFFGPHGVRA